MDFLNTLLLVGAIQGVISGVILYRSKKGNAQSNRLLAALVLVFSLILLNLFLMEIGFRYLHPVAEYMSPILFLYCLSCPSDHYSISYVRSIVEPDFNLTKKDLRHFLLVLFDLFPYAIGLILVVGMWSDLIARSDEGQWRFAIDTYQEYIGIVRWLSVTTFLYFSWKVVRQKNISEANTKWASTISLGVLCLSVDLVNPSDSIPDTDMAGSN